MSGVRAAIVVEVVDVERRCRTRGAMASRCRTAFVEPPVAATPAMAFSSESRVTMLARADVPADEVHDQLAAAARRFVLAVVLGRDAVEPGR